MQKSNPTTMYYTSAMSAVPEIHTCSLLFVSSGTQKHKKNMPVDSITKNESLDMDINFSSQVLQVALAMYESSDNEATVYIKERW